MAVVDITGTCGQSQMSGEGTGTQAPACDPDLCWEWDGGLPLRTVLDPTSTTTSTYKANTGSPVPAFSKRYTQASGRPLVIVRGAVGGSAMLHSNAGTVGDWSEDGTLFDNLITRMLAAFDDVTSLGHTIGNVNIINSQGYADASKGHDIDLYGQAIIDLTDRFRTALSQPNLKVYHELMYAPAAAPNQTVKDNCLSIRAQELDAEATHDGVKMAFSDGQYYADWHWLKWDNLHYNQAGLNHMGESFAEYIAEDLGLTIPPQTISVPTSHAARRLFFADAVVPPPPPPLPLTYNTPGTYTWTCPDDVTAVKVEAWGAGGGGRGGVTLGRGGMGGGGGEYRYLSTYSVTPGSTYTIVVGAGGTGSTYNTNDGTNGGASSFQGSVLTANGGGKPASASAVGAGGTGGSGGTGVDGTAGSASPNSAGSDGGAGGAAGGTAGGAGGVGGTSTTIVGGTGSVPGGGGGGGKGNTTGANGGNGGVGQVVLSLPD